MVRTENCRAVNSGISVADDVSADGDACARSRPSFVSVVWAFSRPHTIVGTVLAVVLFYLLAAADSGRQNVTSLLTVLIASLTLNVYIVGLNQLTDIVIDRINKPYLPLAAGTLSMRQGFAITAVCGAIALGSAAWQGPYLFATIAAIFAIGTVYSLPPRLKRYPVAAAASITFSRALIGNIGIYLAYLDALGARPAVPLHILVIVVFLAGFSVVISLMKDVPDIEGDRQNDIRSFSVRLGPARIMLVCRIILSAFYVALAAIAFSGLGGFSVPLVAVLCVVSLAFIWLRGNATLATKSGSIRYYQMVWRLYYAALVSLPVAFLIAAPLARR